MGLFDAVIRVNLEGRTARDKQTLIWDYGPALYYPRVWVNCFEELDWEPDLGCGEHNGGTGVYIHSTSYRWDGPLIKGEQLVNSNEYYLQYNAEVRPAGYNTMRMPYFETPYFNCYGGANSWCYFP
ncbi:MAG TPA: hypothetical protein VHH15_08210 [Actinophytocola sp.]|nr:hypothetical protein [Actinophytocola sp.]